MGGSVCVWGGGGLDYVFFFFYKESKSKNNSFFGVCVCGRVGGGWGGGWGEVARISEFFSTDFCLRRIRI